MRAGLAAAAALLVCARSGAEPPACLASVALEPPVAFVGQQVVYRAQILRRDDVRELDWGRAPSFPELRAEALPSLASETSAWRDGRRYEGFEERRALFPLRAGEILVPAASLRCRAPGGVGEEESEIPIPSVLLRVRELPAQGRPTRFGGAVGRLAVEASVEPDVLALGGSARLAILVEGEADLFGLAEPFDPEANAGPDLEILARPAELARDAGRRLRLRRWFRYDLVPHRAGGFELPAIEVAWFDPERERYAVASAAPLRFSVRAAAGIAEPERERAARGGGDEPEARAGAAPSRAALVATLALVGALFAAAAALALRARARRETPERGVRDALQRAAAACAAGERERENAALALALRLALEAAGTTGARADSSEELLTATAHDPELRAAVELLAHLDRARFATEADPAPSARLVEELALRLCARERSR